MENNIMYFIDDDDFAQFCINPNEIINTVVDGNGVVKYFVDYDFTPMYLNAVKNGIKFCIQDVNSHVNKDGYLGYRTCSKKIDNIERYYGED